MDKKWYVIAFEPTEMEKNILGKDVDIIYYVEASNKQEAIERAIRKWKAKHKYRR